MNLTHKKSGFFHFVGLMFFAVKSLLFRKDHTVIYRVPSKFASEYSLDWFSRFDTASVAITGYLVTGKLIIQFFQLAKRNNYLK